MRATFGGEFELLVPPFCGCAADGVERKTIMQRGGGGYSHELLKITVVVRAGKAGRAVNSLRTESASGMLRATFVEFEPLVSMFGGCAADEAAHGRRQCGVAAEAF